MWNILAARRYLTKKESNTEQVDSGPLRDELYSGDQLTQHAKETAPPRTG